MVSFFFLGVGEGDESDDDEESIRISLRCCKPVPLVLGFSSSGEEESSSLAKVSNL